MALGLAIALPARSHDLAPALVGPGIEAVAGTALALAFASYAVGLARLWHRAGIDRGIGLRAASCFAGGCVLLAGTIFGPLDALAQERFAVHMVQHELLMVVVAPLLVLGHPLGAWSWAFSLAARRRIGSALRAPALVFAWRVLTAPLTAWSLHALALWVWHAPVLFRAAAADATLHAVQHGSFLITALLLWWAVLAKAATRPGVSLLLLFTTMVHTGALGALLVFSPTDWYASGALGGLAEQQLGGLIMWIPGGVAYVIAALAVAYRLLEPLRPAVADERVRLRSAP
jgi:putative membrane protein